MNLNKAIQTKPDYYQTNQRYSFCVLTGNAIRSVQSDPSPALFFSLLCSGSGTVGYVVVWHPRILLACVAVPLPRKGLYMCSALYGILLVPVWYAILLTLGTFIVGESKSKGKNDLSSGRA